MLKNYTKQVKVFHFQLAKHYILI
ncbi:protein of unknown function [Xenorhabdus poinarii G6]|uniref:Uncharacterized protein n=1 Tax=Xenorhabdus poinarii G6 TaxID=1354304 RepID=A0A068R7N2_9GAMM|nr:protein of unknown function [Xenorhabdus poinarii G6]